MTEKNRTENVKLAKGYTQVCVWPGTFVGDEEIKKFPDLMKEKLGVRVQYLETIHTRPNKDPKTGEDIEDTGGRADVFFAVHQEDVGKFAIPRLQLGIRWIEDALAEVNGYSDNPIYPERVYDYKSWEA